MPAKRPRAREYERISARKATSLSAEAVRPTGPAAALASPPSLTLLLSMLVAERGLIIRRTKSGALPPSLRPALPPSSAIILGGAPGAVEMPPARQGLD